MSATYRRLAAVLLLGALLSACQAPPASTAAPPSRDVSLADTSSDAARPDAASDVAADTLSLADTGTADAADVTDPDPCEVPEGAVDLDPYGGDRRVTLEATGFFRVAELCRRWWLVTPDGHPTWSIGVNGASPWGGRGQETGRDLYAEAVAARYDSHEAWADATRRRLFDWGFNTAGSWSADDLMVPRMPTTINLRLSGGDWLTGEVTDWFDPAWAEGVNAVVAERVAPLANTPKVIGWFLDNEIRWGSDWRGAETLLQLYLSMGADAPGKAVAVDLLLDELGSVEAVNALLEAGFADRQAMLASPDGWQRLQWRVSETAEALTKRFLALAAERYFSVTVAAIRRVDPNHLILGNREVAVLTHPEVWKAAARHVDVLSANHYVLVRSVVIGAPHVSGAPHPGETLDAIHALTGLPILITEFGFRASDSGLPNSWPPIYPTYETQQDRADAFEAYVRKHHDAPWIVGYHWFRWVDQPPDGRFDGEDNNFGLVTSDDAPWEVLTERMTRVNRAVFDQLRVPSTP